MSAFMCSDLHLSVLAVYAVKHGLDLIGESSEPLRLREERVFRMLKRENAKSLDARYPRDNHADEANSGTLDENARAYTRKSSHVALIKACHCYEYQACEHAEWKDSRARKLVRDIEASLVATLPGYNDAPWSI